MRILECVNLQGELLGTAVRAFLSYIGSCLFILLLSLSLGLTLQVVFALFAENMTGRHLFVLFFVPLDLLGGALLLSEVLDFIKDAASSPPLPKFRAYFVVLARIEDLRRIDLVVVATIFLMFVIPCFFTEINVLEHPGNVAAAMLTGGLVTVIIFTVMQIVGKVAVTLDARKLARWSFASRRIHAREEPPIPDRANDSVGDEEKHSNGIPSESELSSSASDEDLVGDRALFSWVKAKKPLSGATFFIAIIIVLVVLLDQEIVGFIVAAPTYLVCAVGLAYSLHLFLPRMLGHTFMIFGGLFIGLGICMAFSTRAHVMADKYAKLSLVPEALEPPPLGFGNIFLPPAPGTEKLWRDSTDIRGNHYPLCDLRWGQSPGEGKQLTALDLNVFAAAVYYDDAQDILSVVLNATEGTGIAGGITMEHVEPADKVGRWVVFKVPQARVRIVAIRGTKYFHDALADAHMWSTVKILQMFNRVLPILNILPTAWFQWYIDFFDLDDWMGNPDVWGNVLLATREVRQQSEHDGYEVVITGHSLGGGMAQIVGAQVGSPTLTWSAVGVLYSLRRFGITEAQVIRNIINVKPQRDAVPNIDIQPGFTQSIDCDSGTILSCHSVRKSGCEIYRDCGDPRGRNMTANCQMVLGSSWHPHSNLNFKYPL